MFLAGCSKNVEDVSFQNDSSSFTVVKSLKAISVETNIKKADLKNPNLLTKTVVMLACMTDTTVNQNIIKNHEFSVEDETGKTLIWDRTNSDGCLQWQEDHLFDSSIKKSYDILAQRTITGRGAYKGSKTIELALNFGKDDAALAVKDLRVFNKGELDFRTKQELSSLSTHNDYGQYNVNDASLVISEEEYSTNRTVFKLDTFFTLSKTLVDSNGSSKEVKLSEGDFTVDAYLIEKNRTSNKVRSIAIDVNKNGTWQNGIYSVPFVFDFTKTFSPSNSYRQFVFRIRSGDQELASIRYSADKIENDILSGSIARLPLGMSVDQYLGSTYEAASFGRNAGHGFYISDINVAKGRDLSKARDNERVLNVVFDICLNNTLRNVPVREGLGFTINFGPTLTINRPRQQIVHTDTKGCFQAEAPVYYSRSSQGNWKNYILKITSKDKKLYKGITIKKNLCFNPNSGNKDFAIAKRPCETEKIDNTPIIVINEIKYQFRGSDQTRNRVNHYLNYESGKRYLFAIDAHYVTPYDFSGDDGISPIPDGKYKLRLVVAHPKSVSNVYLSMNMIELENIEKVIKSQYDPYFSFYDIFSDKKFKDSFQFEQLSDYDAFVLFGANNGRERTSKIKEKLELGARRHKLLNKEEKVNLEKDYEFLSAFEGVVSAHDGKIYIDSENGNEKIVLPYFFSDLTKLLHRNELILELEKDDGDKKIKSLMARIPFEGLDEGSIKINTEQIYEQIENPNILYSGDNLIVERSLEELVKNIIDQREADFNVDNKNSNYNSLTFFRREMKKLDEKFYQMRLIEERPRHLNWSIKQLNDKILNKRLYPDVSQLKKFRMAMAGVQIFEDAGQKFLYSDDIENYENEKKAYIEHLGLSDYSELQEKEIETFIHFHDESFFEQTSRNLIETYQNNDTQKNDLTQLLKSSALEAMQKLCLIFFDPIEQSSFSAGFKNIVGRNYKECIKNPKEYIIFSPSIHISEVKQDAPVNVVHQDILTLSEGESFFNAHGVREANNTGSRRSVYNFTGIAGTATMDLNLWTKSINELKTIFKSDSIPMHRATVGIDGKAGVNWEGVNYTTNESGKYMMSMERLFVQEVTEYLFSHARLQFQVKARNCVLITAREEIRPGPNIREAIFETLNLSDDNPLVKFFGKNGSDCFECTKNQLKKYRSSPIRIHLCTEEENNRFVQEDWFFLTNKNGNEETGLIDYDKRNIALAVRGSYNFYNFWENLKGKKMSEVIQRANDHGLGDIGVHSLNELNRRNFPVPFKGSTRGAIPGVILPNPWETYIMGNGFKR